MKKEFKDRASMKTYIRNNVNRKYRGSTACILCGKENASILYNENDEAIYDIAFVCIECRKGKTTEELQALPKINFLENVEYNTKNAYTKNMKLTLDLILVVEGALTYEGTMMEYIKEKELSYRQFIKLLKLYDKEVEVISYKIKERFEKMRISKILNTKNNNLKK